METLQKKKLLLESIIHKGQEGFSGNKENLALFISQFFERTPLEFIQKFKVDVLAEQVKEMWELFQENQPGVGKLRLRQGRLAGQRSQRLFIEAINTNRPFLIDSIEIALDRWGIKSEIITHPVLGVVRDEKGNLKTLYGPKDILEHTHRAVQEESVIYIQAKTSLGANQLAHLEQELRDIITQVSWVVDDWPQMQSWIKEIGDHLTKIKSFSPVLKSQAIDTKAFLHFLDEGNFVFLGARYYSAQIDQDRKGSPFLCLHRDETHSNLGLFQGKELADTDDLIPDVNRTRLVPDTSAADPLPFPILSVIKTNQRSQVHRTSRIDSIEIMDFNDLGQVQGLYQFIGIYTKNFFVVPAFNVPMLARKIQEVFNQFALAPHWHDGKILISILNSIPRDEMLYLTEAQLCDIGQKTLQLKDRGDLALFVRQDIYGRYATVLIYIPKERYSFYLKDSFEKNLEKFMKGKVTSINVSVGDLPFARLIYVITFPAPRKIEIDTIALEAQLATVALTWGNLLEKTIAEHYEEEEATVLQETYANSFPAAYQEKFLPSQAIVDIGYCEKIIHKLTPIEACFYADESEKLKVKIFHKDHPLSLSDILPILQNLGIKAVAETSYKINGKSKRTWIHDFETDLGSTVEWRSNEQNLIAAFQAIWAKDVENDELNQLILIASLTVRQVVLVRAYAKFLRQIQHPYSLAYIGSALSLYPEIIRRLVALFETKFDPLAIHGITPLFNPEVIPEHGISRLAKTEKLEGEINELLLGVERLDHDRILRHLLNAIQATIRTNYYQINYSQETDSQVNESGQEKDYIALKFECAKLDDLPLPRPLYEIYVYSTRVEAIHLRGGKVARGGIRWSDRLEDFRTETLGLMKAQMVKNAVIVPEGSKGGFIVRAHEKYSSRSQLLQEVIQCYQIMIHGLLDITDNIIEGQIIPPAQIIRYDGDDPYLVVAADKGTSTFSDRANSISKEYNFWLDDAFASGGSAGYDHKKMGITARGAWESVKRHFLKFNFDTQSAPFTVVGVGDMSGDVFGNGMLQSEQILLIAAFNDRDIFLDPKPNPTLSFQERKRLFELPRSSWTDYDPALISEGGGVFKRSLKTIPLSPQIKEALGIVQDALSPDALIQGILQAPVDLLWFGGIGTFVKASTESNLDVGDQSNNERRVNAKTLRAKVIGEGANLGMTQQARIEYALKGGCLNTDAIDNSGGVDCSDHEVNIKILFQTMGKKMGLPERDELLKEMTDNVAQLVIADNYRQAQILTVLESLGESGLNIFQSLTKTLEGEVNLNPVLEFLPEEDVLERRRARNQGMTRPELAILLAYSKISLHEKIVQSSIPDNPKYLTYLYHYFPKILQDQFEEDMLSHPLKREIIATVLSNEMINRVGPAFLYEMRSASSQSDVHIVEAFFELVTIFDLRNLWSSVDDLDSIKTVDTKVQTQALLSVNQMLGQAVLWYLRQEVLPEDFSMIFKTHKTELRSVLMKDQLESFEESIVNLTNKNIPRNLAYEIASLAYLPSLLDITSLSKQYPLAKVSKIYFTVQSKVGLDWLIDQALNLQVATDWERNARASIIDDLRQIQVSLVSGVIFEYDDEDIENWVPSHNDKLQRVRPILASLKSSGRPDLGLLEYGVRQFQRLIRG